MIESLTLLAKKVLYSDFKDFVLSRDFSLALEEFFYASAMGKRTGAHLVENACFLADEAIFIFFLLVLVKTLFVKVGQLRRSFQLRVSDNVQAFVIRQPSY